VTTRAPAEIRSREHFLCVENLPTVMPSHSPRNRRYKRPAAAAAAAAAAAFVAVTVVVHLATSQYKYFFTQYVGHDNMLLAVDGSGGA